MDCNALMDAKKKNTVLTVCLLAALAVAVAVVLAALESVKAAAHG